MSSSILTTLGLRAAAGAQQPPNHAAGYLITNFVLAYALMSTRAGKMSLGIDHNSAPREDLAKYGEPAVQAGKISREALNRLKRQEAAHANSVEGFPLFVAGSMSLFPFYTPFIKPHTPDNRFQYVLT